MAEEKKESIFQGVDLKAKENNTEHHTIEISGDQLIVRRGQPFQLTLLLRQPFIPELYPLSFKGKTGNHPTEDQGTLSCFGVPDVVERSPSAKAVWKIELHPSSSQVEGILNLTMTPPADTPIGKYTLTVSYMEEEMLMAEPVVLYNPWCSDDWVFLPDEKERQEYVMNEQGIVYKGSGNYIFPMDWDFGQFEDSMVSICMKILDLNHKHADDPADDVSARCNPIYVSRVISAMINSEDDCGVLEGRWGGPYWGGSAPSHWSGSYAILKKWLIQDCHPVKYGQCWVFAAVMCSVMRLLGIPCRVVTNYQSAHDNNRNLTIDVYHADYGVREKPSHDSVWNFHVWVEGWMRRPDLDEGGKFDGWQVLDPTPQETSDGVYCCGPAPVKAIHDGETALKYDIPFVFAEVNADCIDWLVKADGTLVKIFSDPKRVGQNISTKSIGSNKRLNITDTYKHREGSEKERSVFIYACTRDYSTDEEGEMEDAENEEQEEDDENEEMEEEDENASDGGVTGVETEDVEDAEMEEEPENVEREEEAGNAGTEEAAGNAGTEEAAGNAGTEETAGNTETEEAAGNTETEGAAGNTETEGAAGNTGTEGAAGNTGTEEAAGNTETEGAAGNTETEGAAGNTGTEEAAGNTATEEAAGNTETEEAAGKAETEEAAGNAETEEAAGNTGTEGAAGNAETEEAAGNTETAGAAGNAENVTVTPVSPPPPPPVSLRFEEVTKPRNGRNVSLSLVLHSNSRVARPLSINTSVQAMRYNGTSAATIQTEVRERILQPGKELFIPILVPFSDYNKHMLDCDIMKVSALVTDKQNTDNVYLAEDDVVLLDPPIAVIAPKTVKLNRTAIATLVFMNPVQETLQNCTLTFSGNGLWKEERQCKIADIKKNTLIRVTFHITPYKTGDRIINVDFDCSIFRDIKGKCKICVKP